MKKILFATNNSHKLKEINEIAGKNIEILSPLDLGYRGDIPEDYDTLEENALQKAKFLFERFNIPCFADDTGLEVTALEMKPGVYSARYAGDHKSSRDNIIKLLKELETFDDRSARFRTVIAYLDDKQEKIFEGIVNGKIAHVQRGEEGFGYDPVFIPEGQNNSFAEMSPEEKNSISHRARAMQKFVNFLDSGM
ncbi:MAG: RdgB/HAM1 family non-canonical purine NTP pyrophosphatase [Bacteroidota bacterium]